MYKAPSSVQREFSKQLYALSDEDRFASVKRYYDTLIGTSKPKTLNEYSSIDDRVDQDSYFWYPTETEFKQMNCFERASCIYFALTELYPSSNPRMVHITMKERSKHAAVLFMHEGYLYGTDPTWQYFGKASIEPDKLTIAPYLSNLEKEILYDKMEQVDDHELQLMIEKLRARNGMVDFVYDSGQVGSEYNGGTNFRTGFIRIQPGTNRIITEIRSNWDSPVGKQNSGGCLRIETDPYTGKQQMIPLTFRSVWWSKMNGGKKAELKQYELDHFHMPSVLLSAGDYLWKRSHGEIPTLEATNAFMSASPVQERFMPALERIGPLPSSIQQQLYGFLHVHYKTPEATIIPKQKAKIITITKKDGTPVKLNDPEFLAAEEAIYESMQQSNTELMVQQVAQVLRIHEDAQRFTAHTARIIKESA